MKKHLIFCMIIVVILCVIEKFSYNYDIISYKKKYEHISFFTVFGDKIASDDSYTINKAKKIINKTKKRRIVFAKETLHSPDCIIVFSKEKQEEKIFVYGDKILFKNKQYKIYNFYEFYKELFRCFGITCDTGDVPKTSSFH